MAIDVNGVFGRWPTRTPGIWEPAEYLRKMDQFGIARALVCATAAILDHTVHGNDRIAELLTGFPDRFLGAAVINPHPDPEQAAAEARRRFAQGFRALRLYPAQHGYATSDAEVLDPVMVEAERVGRPVLLTLRVTEGAGLAETPAAMARALAARYSAVDIIVSGATLADRILLTRIGRKHPNLHVEVSQMLGAESVRQLVEALGAEHVLLGTGMGVLYASPAVRRVESAAIGDANREAVLDGNARRLLGIP